MDAYWVEVIGRLNILLWIVFVISAIVCAVCVAMWSEDDVSGRCVAWLLGAILSVGAALCFIPASERGDSVSTASPTTETVRVVCPMCNEVWQGADLNELWEGEL